MNSVFFRRLALLLTVAMLVGCSGGGGSGGSGGSGSVAPVSQAPVVTLTPEATKQFVFTWEDVANEAEYRLLENPDGMSGYTEVATIPANSGHYRHEVFLPERINASYLLQACNALGDCKDSSEMFVGGTLAEAVGYFKASNGEVGDYFGEALSISSDGKTLAVGAPDEDSAATRVGGDQSDNEASASGAVYVFTRTEGGWDQQGYLKASNTGSGDLFGSSVSLSSEGNTLAVGAPREDSAAIGVDRDQSNNDATNSGAVYVFNRTNDGWSQPAYLKASSTDPGAYFGVSVALSADGNTLGIGAESADGVVAGSGAAYVFERQAGSWAETALLVAETPGNFDLFGQSVALSKDGNTLAVGAFFEDSAAKGVNGDQADDSASGSGAVYVFTRTEAGWGEPAYLKASNTNAGDRFGSVVSLSADGNTLAVGATGEDSATTGVNGQQSDNSAERAGAVYVFTRTQGNWAQQAYLKASNTDEDDGFGFDVSLSADGQTLAVGALFEASAVEGINGDQSDNSESLSGAVYLFTSDSGQWGQTTYVKPPTPFGADDAVYAVALSGDASVLAVGAPEENGGATGINGDRSDRSASESGAVFLY